MTELAPPGQLIDVDGFKMHYTYNGGSAPTIVFEAGLGDNHLIWSFVQPVIESFASVFAYDRAGMGWSEINPQLRTTENIVTALHTLLELAEIPAPYILVGHSRGGEYVRHFARRYPNKVGGLILVDSAHEQSHQRYTKHIDKTWQINLVEKAIAQCEALMQLSHGELAAKTKQEAPQYFGKNSPVPVHLQELLLDRQRPRFFEAMLAEHKFRLQRIHSQESDLEVPNLGDLPLTVLYADPTFPPDLADEVREALVQETIAFQKEFAACSTQSRLQHVPNSSHNIQIEQPQVVIEAIREMVDIVKAKMQD